MMERLKLAHDNFFTAPAEDKKAALQRYLTTLIQFNAFWSHGELPPADNPMTDNPVTDNPVTDNTVTDSPVTDNLVTDNPVADSQGDGHRGADHKHPVG